MLAKVMETKIEMLMNTVEAKDQQIARLMEQVDDLKRSKANRGQQTASLYQALDAYKDAYEQMHNRVKHLENHDQ
jgi:ABC-type transporter Mla subunit MlaD|tara:strand:+ start:296 stop:520 length:225 start_codon:yes stop_codon:yes gene_type:complete